MIVFGIDPGWSGAVATIERRDGKKFTNVYKMPETEYGIADICRKLAAQSAETEVHGVLEHVWGRAGEAQQNVWKFAGNFFSWRMGLIMAGVRYDLVTPQKWQAEFQLLERSIPSMTRKEAAQRKRMKKNRHKVKAQELFPRIRVNLDNCDALLIAVWADLHLRRKPA